MYLTMIKPSASRYSSMIFIMISILLKIIKCEEICVSGYLSDTYCIEQGVFLDKPNVSSLMYPELHTAHCLLDPPQCVASFEILKPPEEKGGNYTRWYKLDEVGLKMAIEYARRVGAKCNNCTGTIEQGITITARGLVYEMQSTNGPPILNVTSVDDLGCDVRAPVMAPGMAPVAAPARAPTAQVMAPASSAESAAIKYVTSLISIAVGMLL
jgi:hypothetical protein